MLDWTIKGAGVVGLEDLKDFLGVFSSLAAHEMLV